VISTAVNSANQTVSYTFNPLTGILKPLSNGPFIIQQYGNWHAAVDEWAVTFGTEEGLRACMLSPLLAVPNITANQQPVYQLHNIRYGTVIAFAL